MNTPKVGRSRSANVRHTRQAVLVYQAGIANVFAVRSFNMADYGREARRLLQSDFRTCEAFAAGLDAAGILVASAWCNQAGDIIAAHWNDCNFSDAPFSDSFRQVWSANVHRNN